MMRFIFTEHGSEFLRTDWSDNMRRSDQARAIWNVLDMTSGGRGVQFYPALPCQTD